MIPRTMRRSFALSLLAAIAVSIGCHADTEPIPGSPDDTDVYPKVTLTERSLQDALGVGQPIETRSEAGNLVVTLPVRGRADNYVHIDYRIIWFDADGVSIRPEQSWNYKRLERKQPERLTFVATNPAAVDYNVQIRWGNR